MKLKVVLKKVKKEDDKGYLRISVREKNKTSLKSSIFFIPSCKI